MSESRKRYLASLMATTLEGLSEGEVMQLIGSIIDLGGDEKSAMALDYAGSLLDQFLTGTVSEHCVCRAHYFRANIWAIKRHSLPDGREWHWKSNYIDGEICELRKALGHSGFVSLHPLEQAQTYTNLANILNHTGRFIEAIEYWDRALALVPDFAMAWGNRGIGLGYYAGGLYDSGHKAILMAAAAQSLERACEKAAVFDSPLQEGALHQFSERLNALRLHYNISRILEDVDLAGHSMGRGKKERAYRQWCLDNRLFLNPLNDIGPNSIAAHDVMTLPTLVVTADEGPEPPAIIHYFNIIKQEFCSARFALYEAITTTGVHFSDRGVLLYNTLDYPAFGFAVERMKMAFRGAYAVFDKSAFLLNVYLNLGHPERQVNFRNLWFTKDKQTEAIHPSLDRMPNWPLRGLFWLSKDIFEKNFREVTEPDAQELYELRNHMEHKFVSVHDEFLRSISPHTFGTRKVGVIDISVDSLITKTLRQLKLARAAMIYLSLGVHAEERRRTHEMGDSKKLNISMFLDTWSDSWKRRD